MKWVRASARFFCGWRLAERDAGYSLKGVKTPSPQGQNSYFLLRSPNLAKPGADQCLNPPALLTVAAAPLTFGMIGDFPLRIAKEIPIPVFFQLFTSSLVYQGGLPPCFSADFRPVSGFSEAGGILTLPQRKKRHTGATVAFTVFHSGGVYCFSSVFPATNRDFSSAATTF